MRINKDKALAVALVHPINHCCYLSSFMASLAGRFVYHLVNGRDYYLITHGRA